MTIDELVSTCDDKELLNKVSSSTPINITAALVVSKGIEYKCPKYPDRAFSHTPFTMRNIPETSLDLTGNKFGDLTVIGLSVIRKGTQGKKRSLWSTRCVCGNYELRTSRGLRSHGEHRNLKCYECQYTQWQKQGFKELQKLKEKE